MNDESPQPATPAECQGLAGALQNCVVSGVVVFDPQGRVSSITPEASRMLRLTAAQAVGQSASVLPDALRALVNDSLATGAVRELAKSILLPHPGGTVHVVATPMQQGRARSGVVLVLHELSLAPIEESIRRLDRLTAVGTLSASMAHEIKNALVAVKTFVDLLLDKNRDDELADLVRREMARVNSLISQMLKFAGPARPILASVRVHDVLNHTLRMVQHEVDGKLISLTRKFGAKPDTISGDEYQLEQAFLNLLLNAVEASGPGGALVVETEFITMGTPRLRVSVTDNGLGIPRENMARLFEPFFTTKANGTGLGLHITRRIIQEHSGQIAVESEPDKGTTFSVLLPATAKRA